MKVLILKPSSLGDVIHALPVLRLLKLAHPRSEVHWWINRSLMPLLEADPGIDRLHPFDREGWLGAGPWVSSALTLRELRAERFDWVIDLQGLLRSAVVAWLARGATTLGLDDHREGARAFYDITLTRPNDSTHAVDFNLTVCRVLGIPVHFDFEWIPERPRVASAVRERMPAGASSWVALQPGARWDTKRWPCQSFIELVRLMLERTPGVRFAIMGSADEEALAQTIADSAPESCVNLAGRTSLPEMVEWIRACSVMVTNDTGPMHIAAALGVPSISLFGPTDPSRTGPYGQVDRVLRRPPACAPCFSARCQNVQPLLCLHSITPAEVSEAALAVLASHRGLSNDPA